MSSKLSINEVLEFINDPDLLSYHREQIVRAINRPIKASRREAKAPFRVGMTVTFQNPYTGTVATGKIIKINRINIDIFEGLDGHGHTKKWRVSPGLLKPA